MTDVKINYIYFFDEQKIMSKTKNILTLSNNYNYHLK